jgi:hypothetical protein
MAKEKVARTPIEEAVYQATKAYEFSPSAFTYGALQAIRLVWVELRRIGQK